MDCKELDRISRSGFSKIFEDEVRSVLKDIDLGIDEAPSFLRFSMYDFVEFANEENFFRIPCASKTVYCSKLHDFWCNKYEIVYRTNLSTSGRMSKLEFMRSVIIVFSDFVPVELTRDARSEDERVISELIQSISMRSF